MSPCRHHHHGPHYGSANGSPDPGRLYRNAERGMILGVCAGLADYFGMRDWHLRAIAIVFLFVFPPQMVIIYLIAGWVLKRRPQRSYDDPEEERFRRSVSGQPDRTFHSLRHKFRELEERLAGIERHVTSREYSLDRQFRDLEG